MTERNPASSARQALEAACRDCGTALSHHPWEERPVRCDPCFEQHLRDIDHDFLESYATLGVTSRRTVAETCLRALVLEAPPARKVLAMTIMEQFLLASSDLIGLAAAIARRADAPIVRAFLSFRLDGPACETFFAELRGAPDETLLESFGLPGPDRVARRFPALAAADARELSLALQALLRDLRATGARTGSALLLSELTGIVRSGPALTERAPWAAGGLRADQVASVVLDERRRALALQTVSVDEHRLGEVVDAIDCMTRASSNLIYAFLTVQDEEARLRGVTARGTP